MRTRQRHLAARVNGYTDRPMLCLYWLPARPPEGHWRAHPAAAPCRRTRQRHFAAALRYRATEERGCRVAPPAEGWSRRGRGAPGLATARERASFRKKAGRCVKRTLSGGFPASWPYQLSCLLSFFLKVKQTVFRYCRKTVCARAGTLPVRGGRGRNAPAGVPGQSPGPPEAETTRTCGRSRRRCDRRNRDCCSAPP